MKKILIASVIVSTLFLISSCQKEVKPTPPNPTDTTGLAANLVKDTALLIAKDIYLWYNQIPDTFNARNYADPSEVMLGIRKYSKETGFTNPVDRFSFGILKSVWDNESAGIQQDFGISVFFNDATDLRVKYVERAGPAGLAGIQRGWRILKINGSSNIDTTSSSINYIVNAVFYSTNTSFTFQKPDGSTADITLNASTYNSHPVFADSVYTLTTSKVGYLVLNSFLGDTADIYNDFSRVFTKFENAGVNDVVIDLRYNGGGYVSISQRLANYLAPTSADGQKMFTQTFNDKHSNWNTTAQFSKKGSLNLSRIFFIVSNNTASASELLINNLKPFLTEKLVGPANHTYGKPVGFFNVPVGDWYVFPISFKTVNKNGDGNYFGGFTIDKPKHDGVDKNWGDREESCLGSVLTYIETGTFGRFATEAKDQRFISGNQQFDINTFKGTIDTRKIR